MTDMMGMPSHIPTHHYEKFFESLYILPDDEVQSIINTYDSLSEYRSTYPKYKLVEIESPLHDRLEDDMLDRYQAVMASRDSTIELLLGRLNSRRLFS